MSYIRWGDDSDVYVYAHTQGGVCCCACILNAPVNQLYPDTACISANAMLDHLQEHINAGHKVPPVALERLRRDLHGWSGWSWYDLRCRTRERENTVEWEAFKRATAALQQEFEDAFVRQFQDQFPGLTYAQMRKRVPQDVVDDLFSPYDEKWHQLYSEYRMAARAKR